MWYADVDEALHFNRDSNGKSMEKRSEGYKTELLRRDKSTIVLRLFEMDIMTWRPGSLELRAGTWQTRTTSERIRKYLPRGFALWSESGLWSLMGSGRTYWWKDGITLHENGKVTGDASALELSNARRIRRVFRQYAKDYMNEAMQGELPAPDSGDCFLCQMEAQSESPASSNHLLSHVEEGYFVPSLLIAALKRERPTRIMGETSYIRDIPMVQMFLQSWFDDRQARLNYACGMVYGMLVKVITNHCYLACGLTPNARAALYKQPQPVS